MRRFLLLLPLCVAVLGFDVGLNQVCLNLSMSAYCAPAHVTSWNCSYCAGIPLQDVTSFYSERENTFGFCGYHADRNQIFVSFRGTLPDSLKNWILNLDGAKDTLYKNVPGAKVEAGFFDGWFALRSQIYSAVRSLVDKYNTIQIWVTGHSLGAAMAELAALDMSQHYLVQGVYNYGCPRVGNLNFSEFYNSEIPQTWRVVNNDDVVPHLPPRLLGYHHTATEVWIHPEGGPFHICNGSGEDPKCSDSVPPYDFSIHDHTSYAPGETKDC